jgi:hypothetical protein
MRDFEELTFATLQNLFEMVETLQQIEIRDILKPDVYSLYEKTLQAAYDALTTVEDAVHSLGMKLEHQHFRLGTAVEVLEPLLILTLSSYDISMETVEKLMSEIL